MSCECERERDGHEGVSREANSGPIKGEGELRERGGNSGLLPGGLVSYWLANKARRVLVC